MILCISSRTDIVAFYTTWLRRRLEEGYVDVRNPYYQSQVSRIFFSDVDAYVFCTKNPTPIIDLLPKFNKPIIFQVTITGYKKDIEPNVPDKKEIIKSVKNIADMIGPENVVIRYDPVFLSRNYSLEYHIKAFDKLCKLLNGSTKKIIISFLDNYKNVQNNIHELGLIPFTNEDYKQIGLNFSKIAASNGMSVSTCFEKIDLVEYGFKKEGCVPREYIKKLTGKNFSKWTHRGKGGCDCAELVDIGAYNTCPHMCKYCYANYDEKKVKENISKHDVNSSFQIGNSDKNDIQKVRK